MGSGSALEAITRNAICKSTFSLLYFKTHILLVSGTAKFSQNIFVQSSYRMF